MFHEPLPRLSPVLAGILACLAVSYAPAQIEKGDSIVTAVDQTPVKSEDTTLLTLPRGTRLTAEEIRGDWVRVTVEQDSKGTTGWVYRNHLLQSSVKEARKPAKRIEVSTFTPTKPRWLGEETILCDVGAAIPFAPGTYVPSGVAIEAFDVKTGKKLSGGQRLDRAQSAKDTLVVSVRRSGSLVIGQGYRDLKSHVYLEDMKGGGAKEIFSCSEEIEGACLAPNGGRAAFCRGQHLWVLDLPGGSPKQLTSDRAPRRHPTFSSDGNTIYFVQETSNKREVHAVDVTTGKQRQITSDFHPASACALSPDGKVLAISSCKGVEDRSEHAGNIWLLDLATGRSERLSSGNADQFPSFSPSGRHVAFQRQEGRYRDSSMPAFNVMIEEVKR